jgi:hypothetical protein
MWNLQFRNLFSNVRKTTPAVRGRVRLGLESLEERTTPATINLSGVLHSRSMPAPIKTSG